MIGSNTVCALHNRLDCMSFRYKCFAGITLWLSIGLDDCYRNPVSSQKGEKAFTLKKKKSYALTSIRT